MDYTQFFTKHTNSMKSSLIRELVASTKGIPGLISFAGGFPSPATFPKSELAALYHSIILEDGNDVLQYGASEGDRFLKSAIRQWEDLPELHDDEILITVGSTNAIYYYTRSLVEDGDVILYEAPSFLGSLVAFDALGAELVGVEIDQDGICLEPLETQLIALKAAGKKVKFLYTIPDFQNPTGITMSEERRLGLLQLAEKYQLPILEDNPYNELRYCGEKPPTIYHLASQNQAQKNLVTHVKSFSKILGPGMRCAYVLGDENLVGKMCSWQQKVNVSPDGVSSRVIAKYLANGSMPAHLDNIATHYRPFLQAMLNALDEFMPAEVTWTKPDGGIFLWLELPEFINADLIAEGPVALERRTEPTIGSRTAMIRAARRAAERAKQHGQPLVLWGDGRIVEVMPEDLPPLPADAPRQDDQ
jgi:2-aminoadipate transaminase